MKVKTPHETNLKGEREAERRGGAGLRKAKRGWEYVLSEYIECIIGTGRRKLGGIKCGPSS